MTAYCRRKVCALPEEAKAETDTLKFNTMTGEELYNLAGYTVKVAADNKTFQIWEGEKRLYGITNMRYLNDLKLVMCQIQTMSFMQGQKKGKTQVQKDIKEALGL